MSESNKWFRDKWNRLDKLKQIEDNWFNVFNADVNDSTDAPFFSLTLLLMMFDAMASKLNALAPYTSTTG